MTYFCWFPADNVNKIINFDLRFLISKTSNPETYDTSNQVIVYTNIIITDNKVTNIPIYPG